MRDRKVIIENVRRHIVRNRIAFRKFFVCTVLDDSDTTANEWCTQNDPIYARMLKERFFWTRKEATDCKRRIERACCGMVDVAIIEFERHELSDACLQEAVGA